MTSLTTAHRSRGRALVAGAVTFGMAATLVAVTATSASAVVDPAPAWVDNPNLKASCGLDVVLVLDGSKSIATAGATGTVKDAASALVSAFTNTNTRVGITTFASDTISSQALVDDTPDSAAAGGALGAAIAAYTPSTAEGTNWEAGVKAASSLFSTAGARAGVQQLMIVVTDGAPNKFYDATGAVVNGLGYPSPSIDAVAPAKDRTNQFKSLNARVLGIGIGNDFTVSGANYGIVATRIGYLERLSQYAAPGYGVVAGQTAGPAGVVNPTSVTGNDPTTGTNYATFDPTTTDTLIQPTPATLATQFRAIADNVCDSTLTLTQLASPATSPLSYRNGGAGWASSAALDSAGPDWVNPVADNTGLLTSEANTSNRAGTSVYQWYSSAPNWTRTATVTLTQKTNYQLVSVVCATKAKGGSWTAYSAKTVSAGQFTVTVGGGQVSCIPTSKYVGTPQASLSLAPRSVVKVYGLTTTVLSGKLLKPNASLAGKYLPVSGRVTIQAQRAGSTAWVRVGTVNTVAKTGAWALAVKPAFTTTYRAVFGNTSALLGNTSATGLVRVATKVTVKLNKNNVAKGAVVVFTGVVAPSKKGQVVYLQALINKHWKNIKSVRLTSRSAYAFSWKTNSRVDYKWRVVKPADKLNYTGVSPAITLVVR